MAVRSSILLTAKLTWIFSHCLKTGIFTVCQPAQLGCLYLDKAAVGPKIARTVGSPGIPVSASTPHPFFKRGKRGVGDLSSPPVMFVLCIVPYLDLFSPC